MNDNYTKELRSTIGCLETRVDVLETELRDLDEMLVRCGFSEGITTLKFTVKEFLRENDEQPSSIERFYMP